MDGYHLNNGLPHYSTAQSTSVESNTLPPISGMPMPYQTVYPQGQSLPQTPLTPQTPLSSASSAPASASTYPQIPHSAPPRTLQPHPSQQPPVSSYSTQSILTPPSTISIAAPHHFAHGPIGSRPAELLPRPSDGISLSQFPQQLASQPNALPKQVEPEPTHVVGQQGRRGILPSAPGRPPPASGKPLVPQKDADGKFPCPNCTKTYLHAKHLKRHMLRHTGDRPYQCKLCKDTFSRSDILKRHFQKCSIRRGTPGDTDHLEGARLHTNKNRLSANVSDQNYLNGVAPQNPGFDPATMGNHLVGGMSGFPMADQTVYGEGMASMSNRTSRASSIMQPVTSAAENRRSISNLEHLAASRPPSFDGAEFGATTLSGGLQHGIPAYAMPPMQPGAPLGPHQYGGYGAVSGAELSAGHQIRADSAADNLFPRTNAAAVNGQQHGMAWNEAYQTNAAEGFGNGMPAASNAVENAYLYSNSSKFDSSQMFDRWDLGNPLAHKAEQLVRFCYPNGTADAPEEQMHEAKLRTVLTVDNVRLFIQLFSHFQGHWPMIHLPTFNPTEAYNGLLLCICAIGAIYSDKLGLLEARWLMELVQNSLHREIGFSPTGAIGAKCIEEIQALILLQVMFVWHGNHAQRQESRLSFWKLADVARHNHLLQPIPPTHPGYSVFHNGRKTPSKSEMVAWTWETWVEQEKRSRAMYLMYLIDSALVIYFNHDPLFDPNELHLQLPCDDAAWEARTSEECAKALGLHGNEVQGIVNTAGSRRMRQPDFRASLRTLLGPSYTLAPRSTNVYSKFILIHAIHTQIWLTQRQSGSVPAIANPRALLIGTGSGPPTPIEENDWAMANAFATRGPTSNPTSGHTTPTQSAISLSPRQSFPTLTAAVAKLRDIWVRDMDLQYPSTATTPTVTQVRRVGFCRDVEHFFFLADMLLKSHGSDNTRLDADTRFQWVFRLLKNIRSFVGDKNVKAGKDIGAVVDIKEEYGVEDLTLNMKLLFAPLPGDNASPFMIDTMTHQARSYGNTGIKMHRRYPRTD